MVHEIWVKVLSSVQSNINKQSFDMWLKDTEPVSLLNNTLRVKVSDEVARRHISENYSSMITAALGTISGHNMFCEFVTGNGHAIAVDAPVPAEPSRPSESTDYSAQRLNPRYTFENFVIGPNNQLAHAAAISVSRAPATQYNPLFIHGGTGLGKTHLMQAIGHHIFRERPYLKVLYVPSEEFVNEFIQAIRTNTITSFKIKYRNVDVLLIDDIQFIEKKEQTQEEFFHTFNTLHNNKKQIIISSDRPPKELSTLEERLRTRFEWGLLADIQPPNLETREAILRNKAERDNMNIPDEVLNYIARRIKSSIRALEAALIRLNMVAVVENEPITIAHAKTHLKDLFDEDTQKKISTTDIMSKVAERFEVSVDDLSSKSRHSRVVLPRFVAMYLTRKMTDLTTIDIGREFGDRDHSTVLNAMNNVEKMIKEDEEFKERVEDMIAELKC
ncbi:MAG: chromosomal replication initiator protein DnaA [Spirochaetes bacterium]|jgi:chromosomal replication initiator protein|nr:chromosomal replication initiator protein DnaA [Spirochaetota bacterium]